MLDKKLIDEEIVKALEEWIKNYDGSYVNFKMLGNVLNLINRLQAYVENYKQIAEYQQSITMDRGFEIKRLKEEIESLQAENERLTIRLRKAEHQLDDAMIMYNTIKAEAYKEFAERLKDKKARYNADNFYVIDYIPSKEVDNLLKELKGTD